MIRNLRKAGWLLLATLGFLFASTAAQADPPSRVARLAYVSGGVSFSPGGESDWSRAAINRPLINGDRLWVADSSRAELQLGATTFRVGDESSLAITSMTAWRSCSSRKARSKCACGGSTPIKSSKSTRPTSRW
jgi:hypothetical protein